MVADVYFLYIITYESYQFWHSCCNINNMSNKHKIIGIAVYGDRIAPRWDVARILQLLEVDDTGQIFNSKEVAMNDNLLLRIEELIKHRVTTLICGGIDGFSAHQISLQGIHLLPWISGQAKDAFKMFIDNTLESGFMLASGGRCCGRWRFGLRGGGGRGRGGGMRQESC